jgi:hypothetical protein
MARSRSGWKPGQGPTPKGAKGGRVTPKGASGRYTAPVPRTVRTSPRWMGFFILGLLLVGVGVIICNYLGVLPGGASNVYLLVGLGLIVFGFVFATGYH